MSNTQRISILSSLFFFGVMMGIAINQIYLYVEDKNLLIQDNIACEQRYADLWDFTHGNR